MRKQGIFPAALNRGKIIKKGGAFWRYINKSDELYIFWATLTYYIVSTANINNKTIFISLLILWVIYNLRLKNIRQSLLLTALASLVFLVGKTWTVELISPKLLRSTDFPLGYIAFIVVTPFQYFSSLIAVFLSRDVLFNYFDMRRKVLKLLSNPTVMVLCLFFLWQIVSAVMAENIYNIAFISSLQSLSYLVVLIGLLSYFAMDHSYVQKIVSQLGAITIFQTLLSGAQWLRRSTLGLAIEATEETLTYFKGPGQGFFSIRSLGTFSHPNELALFSASMALLFLPFVYLSPKQLTMQRNYYLGFFGAAVFILMVSLGRSAWLSFLICLLVFLFFVEKKWDQHIVRLDKPNAKKLIYGAVLILTMSPMIISRAAGSFDLFKPTGGGETRLKLMKESFDLINLKPLFGSGMGLSGYEMFKTNPKGIISTFPSVVHNLYLLIANESGLPALAAFLLFISFILREAIGSLKGMNIGRKTMVLGPLMALIVFLVNGMTNQVFLTGIFLITTSVLLMTMGRQSLSQKKR
jgi:O-antigen ligase